MTASICLRYRLSGIQEQERLRNQAPFSFYPDDARTVSIDRALRRALLDSVRRVVEEARRAGIDFDGDAALWSASIEEEEIVSPRLWAYYHDLVQAVVREDATSVACIAQALLSSGRSRLDIRRVLAIGDLGPRDCSRYAAIIDDDPHQPMNLETVSPDETARVRALTLDVQTIMEAVSPSLWREIRTFGHQIILATNRQDGMCFGSATSLFLWGAIALNPAFVPDRVTLLETLAHEAAHALLIGLTLGANLTLNDPAERFSSPMRCDPRPMEGVAHATFVLARMVFALEEMAKSDVLTIPERAPASRKTSPQSAGFRFGAGNRI